MQLQCSYGPARMRSTVSVRAQATATPAAAPGVASSGPRKSLVKLLTGEATDRRQRRMLQEPAGPAFMPPLIGETPDFLEKGALKFGLERLVKYGPLFRTSVFGADLVMVADPDLYKAMMQEDSKLVNFSLQGTMNKLMTNFGKKFLSNEDNSRMPMRRIMLPSVTQEAMAGYLPKMNDISRNLVDGWSKLPEWDVSEESRKAAMQFANSLLAGIELDGEEDEKQLRQLLATYFDGMTTYDIDLPGTTLRKALDAYAILQKRVYATVAPQVEAIMAEPQVEPGQRVRKNLLGYLIDGQRAVGMEIKTQDVADMALGVLQAGTDTSSAGLASLLAVLVQRPDIWKRLQDEQRQAIAKYGPNITKEYMDSCKVLDAAVREAARFMPPATLQTRTALVDFQLGPYLIKKGTFLMVNTSTCQAIESEPSWIVKAKMARAEGQPMPLPLGADITRIAQGFSLDRWLSNDPKDRPPLFTFSHGPHTCLGIAIFVQEAKSLLAHMVREYDLQLATEVSWVSMPMLKPGPGTRMRLRRLEQPLTATAAA